MPKPENKVHITARVLPATKEFFEHYAKREGVTGLGQALDRAAAIMEENIKHPRVEIDLESGRHLICRNFPEAMRGSTAAENAANTERIRALRGSTITDLMQSGEMRPGLPYPVPVPTSLQTYFDHRIYVINLDRRTDRWEACREQLCRMGLDSHRVSAFAHPTSGVYGCARSHRQLWRDIAHGPHERALILEDDFSAITPDILRTPFLELPNHETLFPHVHGFKPEQKVWQTFHSILDGGGNANERFAALIPFLPAEWDILYLGASYGEAPISRLNPHVIRTASMKTTTAYAITRDYARRLGAMIDKSMGSTDLDRHPGAIDDVLGSYAKDHRYYCIQPRLFYQRPSRSDISGETVNGLFSMTDPVHEGMV